MKLGDIDLHRTEEGWLATVSITSAIDKSGFTFTVGPTSTLTDLFREIGEVAEGLIGFTHAPRKRSISDRVLQRADSGFDNSKMFLTVPEEDL